MKLKQFSGSYSYEAIFFISFFANYLCLIYNYPSLMIYSILCYSAPMIRNNDQYWQEWKLNVQNRKVCASSLEQFVFTEQFSNFMLCQICCTIYIVICIFKITKFPVIEDNKKCLPCILSWQKSSTANLDCFG